MGLLDVFNSDEGRLGLGLLAAAGPRSDGAGFGQRLQEGMGSVDAWKQNKAKQAYLDMQLKNMQSEIESRAIAQQQAKAKQDMIASLFGGGMSNGNPGTISPGAFTPSNGMGPTMPQSMNPAMNPQKQGIAGMSIDDVAKLKALGGVDVMDAFKWANEPLQLQAGSTYVDRVTKKERMVPKVGEGIAADSSGFYSPLPGYANAQGAIEEAKARATEAVKAGFDPVTITPPNGRPVIKSRLNLLSPQPGVTGSGYAGGSRDGANAESIRLIRSELAKPGNSPSDIAGLQREIARLQAQSGIQPDGVELQSEGEKAASIDAAKANEARNQANKDKATQFKDFRSQLGYAKNLLEAGPTGGGIGSLVDTGLGAFSISTTGGKLAKQLETASAWMIQNIPKAPGAQSEAELRDYKTAAGLVGDKTVPVPDRLAAVDAVNKFIDLWETRMNNGVTVAPSNPKSDEKPPVPMKGMIQNGYKFKGGNPADQANWEKM